ncbi:transposase [Planococcus halotolerans]|uniref:Transposase n=1 Tax=Planococcus halotolerans TaxID=2233542 RepID=A0A365L2L3_9BACL|nr:transposase [Planococcus halotolerans]QHJ70619.1 transposase [Planococcus halotolerans]RAZ79622.1 transposase [Planococcus halotolerans]
MEKHKTPEFREYVAKLIVDDGRKATQLAYEMELNEKSIRRWAADYRKKKERLANPDSERLMSNSDLQKQLADTERRLKERDEEVEILKKAMRVFNKDQT